MVAHHARVSAFGDGARVVEAAEVVPHLRDALLQAAVLRSFVLGEILCRVAAPVGEQEPAAGRHAITSLGQTPARLTARVAGRDGGQADAATRNDFELLAIGQAGRVAE